MARKVTIQDISRESGVSASTVSRVLTGSAPVSCDKRAAVEQAIQRLNYRPSHLARSLKTNITHSVGLLLNDISNAFYSAIARGAEETANAQGYSLILCNTNEEPDRELQYLKVLQDKQVDGIILGPTGYNTDYICELAVRTPVVLVDRQIDCADFPAVVISNEEAAYKATRLLIEKGHRRIGVFRWQEKVVTIAQRYRGYERALTEAGIPIDPALVVAVPGFTVENAAHLALRLLRSSAPPTAIFALNNQLGMGVLSAIRQTGLKIPEHIALIVFDDLDVFRLSTPSITVVKQPAFIIGERAMRLLLEQMTATGNPLPQVIVLPTELILRESV